MYGECGLVEVALELEPRSLDELFVFWIMRNCRQLCSRVDAAHPLDVQVQDSICAWQEPSRFGRGVFAQLHDDGERRGNDQYAGNDGEAASYAHLEG